MSNDKREMHPEKVGRSQIVGVLFLQVAGGARSLALPFSAGGIPEIAAAEQSRVGGAGPLYMQNQRDPGKRHYPLSS